MTTAFEDSRRTHGRARHEPHGPGRPGPLRPGVRASVLIVSAEPDAEAALRDSMSWITAFEDDCGLVLDHDETSLYAVAPASDLRRPDAEDAAEGDAARDPSDFIAAVLLHGRWRLRGEGGHSGYAWRDLYRQAVTEAAPDALCTVWDVRPLPAA